MSRELAQYSELLRDIKGRIRQAQTRAVLAVNVELVRLYWDIGRLLLPRQQPVVQITPAVGLDQMESIPQRPGHSLRTRRS
jgi:hypothetical protein